MVDLPGPTPLRRTAAPEQPQRSSVGVPAPSASARRAGSTAPELTTIASQLADEPAPVDRARVIEIRTAINSGSYSVDADRIAHALLGNG